MARYIPGTVDDTATRNELDKIAQALETPDALLTLDMQYAAPKKYRNGTICLADGSLWKPTGVATPGFYGYYNGAWHFLG